MFNLTQEERRAVLFLIIFSSLGLVTDFLAKRYAPVKNIVGFSEDIGKVNLNTADKPLLMNIPGIGEKLASRIIEYRRQNPVFNAPEELRNIEGITAYKYDKIKDYLVVK